MDFAKAVADNLNLVEEVRKHVLANFLQTPAKAIHDSDDSEDEGSHYISLDWFKIYPILGNRKSLRGDTPVLKWKLAVIVSYPGSFNPFDGGEPPYDDEKDIGIFETIGDCFVEIGKTNIAEHVNSVIDGIKQAEYAKEEAVYFEKYDNILHLCYHGNKGSKCNDCMITSDFAYDTMRENKHFR